MTCPAVLRVVAKAWGFEKTYLIGCKKPDGPDLLPHRGKNHDPDLSQLPLSFGGTVGTWTAKIKV